MWKEDNKVILNDFNNLRWIYDIESGKSQKIVYQYTVQYPKGGNAKIGGKINMFVDQELVGH